MVFMIQVFIVCSPDPFHSHLIWKNEWDRTQFDYRTSDDHKEWELISLSYCHFHSVQLSIAIVDCEHTNIYIYTGNNSEYCRFAWLIIGLWLITAATNYNGAVWCCCLACNTVKPNLWAIIDIIIIIFVMNTNKKKHGNYSSVSPWWYQHHH